MLHKENLETVSDFDKQWTSFQEQKGFYADEEIFFDYLKGLLDKDDLKDKIVGEVGCGNGRFIKIMSAYAQEVSGFEPSGAVEVAKKYCQACTNAIFYKQSIYDVDVKNKFDMIFCLGVLHHLPDPQRALAKMSAMLKPGGLLYIWVYGRENNKVYLTIFKPLMKLTSRLPHWLLNILSFCLAIILKIYIAIVSIFKFLPWPMKKYVLNILKKLDFSLLKLVIYDQLNPKIANYYSQKEIYDLVEAAGFKNISTYHRYGYSWSVKAIKI